MSEAGAQKPFKPRPSEGEWHSDERAGWWSGVCGGVARLLSQGGCE